MIVLALPAERARRGPGLDDEVVRLLEALAVEMRRCVVGDALTPAATHETRHQATVGDHVDHGQLLGQPQGIIPDRQDIAQDDDFGFLRLTRQDGSAHIRDALHAEGRAVVLVEHQGIKAHLFSVHFLI